MHKTLYFRAKKSKQFFAKGLEQQIIRLAVQRLGTLGICCRLCIFRLSVVTANRKQWSLGFCAGLRINDLKMLWICYTDCCTARFTTNPEKET